MFYFDDINGKKILKSDLIKTEHFFTTRDSFITSKEEVNFPYTLANKKEICRYLQIDTDKFLCPDQKHTSNIRLAVAGCNVYPETDGLIINSKDIAIFLNFADCTPVIFYDEIKKIGAISHAGWRGTAEKISAKTIQMLVLDFGCSVKNISVAIGPAISECCYNVGEEVFNQLQSTVKDSSGLYKINNKGIFVDLKAYNKRQLEECGIEKFDICEYCTCCNNDLFFSYRKENATTNRHSAVLKIN